ncbi:MAG: class GN sortase [Acidobacteria bacterium]|nr:class GN sortase [Acidobacteriota bacterium]
MGRRTAVVMALLLGAAGGASFGHGVWIYAKGRLAQVLLLRAWASALGGAERPAPWPWADTWPVARLRAPRLGVDEIVLAGASGRTMAFGPGHLDGSAPVGAEGNCVLTGHRDTHFAFLERLRPGDALVVEIPSGKAVCYTVTRTMVLDENDVEVMGESPGRLLTLLTCYPFHALVPGGPGRYAVVAVAPPSRGER